MKLVVFDMDDTLISGSIWLQFNTLLGITPEKDYELYTQFSKQQITYAEWTTLLHTLYTENPSRTEVEQVLTAFKLNVGAREAISICKEHGVSTALFTGSFVTTAQAVAQELGIDYVQANTRCEFDASHSFTHFVSGGDEASAKLRMLQTLCTELDIELTDCIAVGDGANDIPLFSATGNGVAFTKSTPAAKAATKHQIQDLQEFPALFMRMNALESESL